MHPHFADQLDCVAFGALKKALTFRKVVALGEIGLDYKKSKHDKEMQVGAFRTQLNLAIEMKLPIVLHIRNADDHAMQIMAEEKVPANWPIHLHCFTGLYHH